MNGTVLLTGATGKIGGNAAQQLLPLGYGLRILAMPNDPQADRLQRFAGDAEIVSGDLNDPAALEAAVQDVDAVIHLASTGHAAASEHAFFEADVSGTYRLLQAAARARPGVRRFVLASSYTVYGKPRYQPTDEQCPREPTSTLGLVKLTCETLCQAAWRMHGLATVALRFTWVNAGPDVVQAFRARALLRRLQPDIRERIAAQVPDEDAFVALTDDAGAPWTLHVVDVRDVVHGLIRALESPGAPGQAFNLAAPSPVSTVEAAGYLASALNQPLVTLTVPQTQREEISTAKARDLIGYRPDYDFRRMADSAIAFGRGEETGVIYGTWPR